MVDAERRVARLEFGEGRERNHCLGEVVTAAPVEAAEWPLAAIALVARFLAESAAIVAAVLAGPVEDT